MARQAMVLVCDEFLVSMTGKFYIHGVYTTDIGIPSELYVAPQLVFVFLIETDLDDLFQSLAVEVTFPGEQPAKMAVPLTPFVGAQGRTRWITRWPFVLRQITLRQGQIKTKVIHEKGEIITAGPWISLTQQTPSISPN
jgi:hypothetical protein